MIHGEDGYDVTFSEESLVVGLSYRELGLGVKVSYGLFLRPAQSFPPPSMCSLRSAVKQNQASLWKAYSRRGLEGPGSCRFCAGSGRRRGRSVSGGTPDYEQADGHSSHEREEKGVWASWNDQELEA